MSDNFAIVTGANSAYFYYAQGLILSLHQQEPDIDVYFFDFGCNEEELDWLRSRGVRINQASWDFEFPGRDALPEYFKAMTARPYLPEYFSDHDILVWMDADTWLQEWTAIDLYVQGAAQKGFAVTPEVHASYAGCLHRGAALQQFLYEKYWAAFGQEMADKLQSNAVINTGVCAMHRESPFRQVWIDTLGQGLQQARHYMVELLSMNLALYENFDEFYPDQVELLPPTCNWMCHQSLPVWDEDNGLFRSPTPPHEIIYVIHRTTDVLKRQGNVALRTLSGKTVSSTLEYAGGTYGEPTPSLESWQEGSGWAVNQ